VVDCSTIRLRGEALRRTRHPNDETQATIEAWQIAVEAAESKKATAVRVLDLRELTSFTDYFVICTGGNSRQIQAIADAVGVALKESGRASLSLEGYDNAEWVLADYGDFIVHVFSEKAREYYDLDRLWRSAKPVFPAE
jgi:ribosome-associated protein